MLAIYMTFPKFLRDGHYASASKLGDSIGYKYPHDFPNHFVKQEYLPKEAKGKRFFLPMETDSEKNNGILQIY